MYLQISFAQNYYWIQVVSSSERHNVSKSPDLTITFNDSPKQQWYISKLNLIVLCNHKISQSLQGGSILQQQVIIQFATISEVKFYQM